MLRLYELINKIYSNTTVTGYLLLDDSLAALAQYFGLYDKKEFSSFVESYHNDNFEFYREESIGDFFEDNND